MSLWNRIAGRCNRGRVSAKPVLAAAAALFVMSGSGEWIATPLPNGTTLYVRYGKPGGVRIERGRPAEGTAPDGAARSPAVSPGVTPPGMPAPVPAAWGDSLAAQVRRILAEELAALPMASRTRIQLEWSPAPPAADTLATPVPPARKGRIPDTLAVSPGSRVAAPDSGGITPGTAPAPPVIPPVRVEVPTLIPRTEPPPEPRVVREAFTSDGLFTTQLLLFETADAVLLPVSRDILRVVAGVLRDFPEARVRVEGYTDRRGGAAANLDLSRRRAEAVRDYLVQDGGLDPGRVEAVGYGEEHPVSEDSTPTSLALNRRVQIRVLNPEALRRPVEDH